MKRTLDYCISVLILLFFMDSCKEPDCRLLWVGTGDRYMPEDVDSVKSRKPFIYDVWKGESVSGMAVLIPADDMDDVRLKVRKKNVKSKSLPDGAFSASFVEYVMADVIDTTTYGQCGYREKGQYDSLMVADLITSETKKDVKAGKLCPIWLKIKVPQDAMPGKYSGELAVITPRSGEISIPFDFNVSDRVLPKPSEWKFHLDLWQNPYAVARYHKVEPWSEEHFESMRPVMEILASAGQKSVTATILDRPWNGQTYDPYASMVSKIRNCDGSWTYDYSVFDKWVEFMETVGIDGQINCYSMIPWSLKFDYIDAVTGKVKYIQADPKSPEYKSYWGLFISNFASHLREKGWFDKTMIAMDERPLDAMSAALELIRSVEPDFKVSLAGNYHKEIEDEIWDLSIPFSMSYPEGVIQRRRSEGKKSTFYTCCAEAYPNTFMDSSLHEVVWLPWRALAADMDGYLRWAYNSWPEDPVHDSRFRRWASGDCFIVYPDGCSSVRMEKLIEGIQDVEKASLRMEEWRLSGDSESLSDFKEILSCFTFEELTENGAESALELAKELL